MVWNVFFVFIFSMWMVDSMEDYYLPQRSSAAWGYFTPPLLQRVPLQPEKTPMEAMVELTNNLGVAILQDHSFSRGNFAFSPYGVASVLVILYEGARSESARQIHRAVKFPSDKDIIRVGFRDIHRHLRSYFSHEGYLSGISLNKQTLSLRPEYKKILRFYGYDIDLSLPHDDEDGSGFGNNIPELNKTTVSTVLTEAPEVTPPGDADKNLTSTEKEVMNQTSPSTVASSITTGTLQSAEAVTSTVTNPLTTITEEIAQSSTDSTGESTKTDKPDIKETTTAFPITEPKDGTTVLPVTESKDSATVNEPQNETTPLSSAESKDGTTGFPVTESEVGNTEPHVTELKDEAAAITVTEMISKITELPAAESQSETTTHPVTGTKDETVGPSVESKDGVTTPSLAETTTVTVGESLNAVAVPIIRPEDETTVLTTNEDEFQINITIGKNIHCKDGVACNNTEETTTTPLSEEAVTKSETKIEEVTNVSIDNGMLIPQANDNNTTPSRIQSSERPAVVTEDSSGPRETKDIKKGLEADSDRDVNKIKYLLNSRASLWLDEKTKTRKARTIADYLKSPRSPDLTFQLRNGMYDTHVSRNADLYRKLPRLLFLVDGAIDTPVPMMIYTNVFSYAYIPRLHSKALEFPLDDVRYKLLILLPVERRGLRQLIYDLADFPLNNVLETVRPARVKAAIPTFMVEGFVILTSSLQKLGIWDVFDPRKANLSGMSTDPELYVRNVEQSVTVVIRNYVEILDIQTRTMAARQMEHEFEATHPFIYFVLDTDTNVALMAGQVLDPLNSRIY